MCIGQKISWESRWAQRVGVCRPEKWYETEWKVKNRECELVYFDFWLSEKKNEKKKI